MSPAELRWHPCLRDVAGRAFVPLPWYTARRCKISPGPPAASPMCFPAAAVMTGTSGRRGSGPRPVPCWARGY